MEQIRADVAKYQKVAASKHGQDLKGTAWDALLHSYPAAKGAARYDVEVFLSLLGLTQQELLIYTDPQTGLQWLRDANVTGKKMTWHEAMQWVKTLRIGGYQDWRLPTKDELEALSSGARSALTTISIPTGSAMSRLTTTGHPVPRRLRHRQRLGRGHGRRLRERLL